MVEQGKAFHGNTSYKHSKHQKSLLNLKYRESNKYETVDTTTDREQREDGREQREDGRESRANAKVSTISN